MSRKESIANSLLRLAVAAVIATAFGCATNSDSDGQALVLSKDPLAEIYCSAAPSLALAKNNKNRDAQPIKVFPPSFPDECEAGASRREEVNVIFDIDSKGRPRNIRVADSTNSCFNRAALLSVQKWRYSPSTADGQQQWRCGVVTSTKFSLMSLS